MAKKNKSKKTKKEPSAAQLAARFGAGNKAAVKREKKPKSTKKNGDGTKTTTVTYRKTENAPYPWRGL